MSPATKASIGGAAVLGFLVGGWFGSEMLQFGRECISTATTTTCTIAGDDVGWQWLVGGVPAAVIFALIALVVIRRRADR